MADDAAPFTIAFAEGVTLTKWTTAWAERRAEVPLAFLPGGDMAELRDGSTTVAFLRVPAEQSADDSTLSIIPLYSEAAMVVLPKGHPLSDLDLVTTADLANEDMVSDALPSSDRVELVAAGGGIAVLPQSIARLHDRKDVTARLLTDGPETRIALAWLAAATTDDIEEFVGIVRGRTARSSRAGVQPDPPKPPPTRTPKPVRKTRAITGRTRPRKPRRR